VLGDTTRRRCLLCGPSCLTNRSPAGTDQYPLPFLHNVHRPCKGPAPESCGVELYEVKDGGHGLSRLVAIMKHQPCNADEGRKTQ
jgi:hypothetical protein